MLFLVSAALLSSLAGCAGADSGGATTCPSEKYVVTSLAWATSTQDSRGNGGSSRASLITKISHGKALRCFFLAHHAYGGSGVSQHAATRLVLWDSDNGFLGAYAIDDVNLYPDGSGGFRYVDSDGNEQVLLLATEKLPDTIWFDGEIRTRQSVP